MNTKILIAAVMALPGCFVTVFGQGSTIGAEGKQIAVDSIPARSCYRINTKKDTVMNDSNTMILYTSSEIYRSDNAHFFCLVKYTYPAADYTGYSVSEGQVKTVMKLVDAGGAEKWSLESHLTAEKIRISDDGRRTIVLWSDFTEDTTQMTVYDIHGNLVEKVLRVRNFYCGGLAKAVYYVIPAIGGLQKAGCIDVLHHVRWEKEFRSDGISVAAVSDDERGAILYTPEKTYSVAASGQVLWVKDSASGLFDLSSDGKYLLWIPAFGTARLCLNATGEQLSEMHGIKAPDSLLKPDFGRFVKHRNVLAFANFPGQNRVVFSFMDLKQNYLGKMTLQHCDALDFSFECRDSGRLAVLAGGRPVLVEEQNWLRKDGGNAE